MATGSSINITIPSAKEAPARPSPRTMSEDGVVSEGTSTEPAGQEADAVTTYNGIALESVLEPEMDDKDARDATFEIELESPKSGFANIASYFLTLTADLSFFTV